MGWDPWKNEETLSFIFFTGFCACFRKHLLLYLNFDYYSNSKQTLSYTSHICIIYMPNKFIYLPLQATRNHVTAIQTGPNPILERNLQCLMCMVPVPLDLG